MKTMNDHFDGDDYPPMKLPKQENADSRFEEKCSDLDDCVSKCHQFFMWYGRRAKNRRDEIRSIVFLECLFLEMMDDIGCIVKMRGCLLMDECLQRFEARLDALNQEMRDGHIFIRTSNIVLKEDEKMENSWIAAMRQDVIDGFRKHRERLEPMTADPMVRERVRQLANRLQLNYQMRMFGCAGDDFDQHTNMVLNALMILATPSMANYSEEEFAKVFLNSINTFKRGNSWQAIEAQLYEDIEQDLTGANCDSYITKMARVKELWWKPTRLAIQVLLRKFGITYVNVLSQGNMGQIGRQLYERLNGIRISKEDDSPLERMTNDDLCRYLKLESELQFFAAKIEKYRLLVNDPMPQDDYFEPEQPRQKIRDAIYNTIHEKGDGSREVLYMKSHWFAIHKVFEYHQMCCGTLRDFDKVMNRWFPTAPHPCDYDSLKNMRVQDIRQKCYTEWSAAKPANVPYRRVALTLAKHLREEGLID